jgi:hypothetical protein
MRDQPNSPVAGLQGATFGPRQDCPIWQAPRSMSCRFPVWVQVLTQLRRLNMSAQTRLAQFWNRKVPSEL